jgi:hypothetical protein
MAFSFKKRGEQKKLSPRPRDMMMGTTTRWRASLTEEYRLACRLTGRRLCDEARARIT